MKQSQFDFESNHFLLTKCLFENPRTLKQACNKLKLNTGLLSIEVKIAVTLISHEIWMNQKK